MKKMLRYAFCFLVMTFALFANVSIDSVDTINQIDTSSKIISLNFDSKAEASTVSKELDYLEKRLKSKLKAKFRNSTNKGMNRLLDLADPNSRAYKELKMANYVKNLDYGYTTVRLEPSEKYLFKNAVDKSYDCAIVGNSYKVGINGNRGPWSGYIVYRSENPAEELYSN